ncbi:enoyl-CoA hydratase [Betaproteobacteria bacterium SCGC AG-212-J23]|nr:enoyl-CoA hydratase [Betaproteobacteria bacterium SCGC AG-212-J23]
MVFNNPERRNAVSLDMWQAIPSILENFEKDPQIRVVVLAGAGDKAFVAGADISQFEKQRSSEADVRRYEEIGEAAQAKLQNFDKPTIAMIRGYCLGAGVNIANVCDLRIAADDARFGIPAGKMGLGYRSTSMKNLVDTVGAPFAREIMLTARQFTAAEALHMGMVHKVVEKERLEQVVREYSDAIAANAPLTLRAAKRTIHEVSKRDYDVELCKTWVRECFESEDYAEGRRAFMEKRKPQFRGR